MSFFFVNWTIHCQFYDTIGKKRLQGSNSNRTCLKYWKNTRPLSLSFKGLAWLADTTELGELDEKTETWLVEEWEDLLFVKSDVKIHAVILGESIYADYPMENFKQDAEEKFQDLQCASGSLL